MTWRLAPSLKAMIAEANVLAPNRSKVSDGTVGDFRHKARASDHNPDDRGIVHAVDLTNDPPRGWAVHLQLEALRRRRDSRVKYIISNRRIAGPGTRIGGWEWQTYDGINAHAHHGHVSVWSTGKAENDVGTPWFSMAPAQGRKLIVVSNYVASLVAPNGGTWHLSRDGGITTDTDGEDGPEAPYLGSVPGSGGLGRAVVRGLLPHKGGYKITVQHPDDSISFFHYGAP